MDTIRKLFQHLHWANALILDRLQTAEVDGKPLILFSHLLHSERVWLARIQGTDSSQLPTWLDIETSFCADLMQRNAAGFDTFFADTAQSEPTRMVAYTNSRGTAFDTSVGDILTHIALHGQYHRGQINLQLRADGFEPVNVDYITFVR